MSFSVFENSSNWASKHHICNSAKQICESTQDDAKSEASSVQEKFKLYLTDHQTTGRGRNKNQWENSNKGSQLLSSFSYYVEGAPQPITAPIIGLALYNSLISVWPQAEFSIKAPNDILLSGKECAGLLIENIQLGSDTRLIIGLGINVFSEPESRSFVSTYLNQHCPVNSENWADFLKELNYEFEQAAKSSAATHLSEKQREDLLVALNRNPQNKEKYSGISPFGDIHTNNQVISWREL